ncbi:MAG: glycerophosphodiester phosphodiesterase family protein [Acidimicrobiia bacterium]
MPPSPWPYLDHPGPLPIAHRGGALDAPENTLAAFERAAALGYVYVETDARVTADGVAVAFHDDDLRRLAGRPGRISELPWSEVATARVGGEAIPRLDELLGSFPGLKVNVDPKQDEVVEPVAEAIRATASVDRVGAGSFSGTRLRRLRRLLGPRLCTSLGPLSIARVRLGSWGLPTGTVPGACVQVPVRAPGRLPLVDRRFVAEAHRRDLQVHVWTVDDPVEMHALLDLGVDGLMTDRPAVLKVVLESRDQW